MSMTVGIDEVGRGCWAGPLVAGAAVLHTPVAGLRDSKKLSPQKRLELALQLKQAAYYGLGWVTPAEVDHLGLTKAVGLAMQRAYDQLQGLIKHLPGKELQIIIDGNINYLSHLPASSCLIRADDTEPSVSAASVIAKVARDMYMAKLAIEWPDYGFDKHVGYGTKRHQEALSLYGITKHHRKSYKPIRAYL